MRGVGRRFVRGRIALRAVLVCALIGGMPAIADTGGPDDFGYVYRDTAEFDGPTYMLEDIAPPLPSPPGPGIEVELADDEMSPAIPIGFTFNYYGVDYTEVFISSNGFLTFLDFQSVGCCAGKPMPQTGTPDAVVTGWWGDLNPGEYKNSTPDTSGGIHYATIGTAPDRVFIVQFKNITHFDQPNEPPVTFQMKLFETTNVMESHYLQAETAGHNHTIGIEDQDGEIGLQYYRDVFPIPVPEAVRFSALADLEVAKSDDPDPIVAGAPGVLTYTVTVTNLGPDPARFVQLSDQLPDEVAFSSATPTQGVCLPAGQFVNCELDQIDANASAVVTIEVIVPPGAAGGLPSVDIDNTATVTSNATDVNPSNNTVTETTTVLSQADLTVTKVGTPETIVAGSGDILTYAVTMINNGPSDAIELTLSDVLPMDLDFVSVIPAGPDCSVSPLNEIDETVSCGFAFLAANDSRVVTIEVRAGPEVLGPQVNNVTIGSTVTPDPNAGNNMTSEVNTVIAEADLSLTKSDSPDPVAAGDVLTYTIDVANAGPSYARDVTITDTIPTGTTLVSATPSQGTCGGDPTVTCDLGTLTEVGVGDVVIEVMVDPAWLDPLSNTASVTTSSIDNVGGNDADTETTDVIVVGDLRITKTDNERYTLPGAPISYVIRVFNDGPSNIIEASVLDIFPAELIAVTWSCTPEPGSTCDETADSTAPIDDVVTIPVGSFVTYVANGTVDPDTTSTEVTNSATVTEPAGSTDPDPGNNEASDTDAIRELVFADGFESGDTSAWSTTIPFGSESIEWRTSLSQQGLADAANRRQPLVEYVADGRPALRVEADRIVGGFAIRVLLRDSHGGWDVREATLPRDAAPALHLVWWASPERGSRSGGAELWIDGAPAVQYGGLANYGERLATAKAAAEVHDDE